MRILLTIRLRFPNSIETPYEKADNPATNQACPRFAAILWRNETAEAAPKTAWTEARSGTGRRAAAHRQAARPGGCRIAPRRRTDDRRGPDCPPRREADHAGNLARESDGRDRRWPAGEAGRRGAAVPVL